MNSREQKKPNADKSAFPRDKNGYAVNAVNDYIADMNRRFEDTVYDYKRQIYELKQELDELKTEKLDNVNKLAYEAEFNSRLSEAQETITALTFQRDELSHKISELSADAVRIRVEAELAEQRSFEQSDDFYEIKMQDNILQEFKPYAGPTVNVIRNAKLGYNENEQDKTIEKEIPNIIFTKEHSENESDGWPSLSETIIEADEIALQTLPQLDEEPDNIDDINTECANNLIYEIKPVESNDNYIKEQAEITMADAAHRSAELIAEAREEAKKLLREAEDESERMRLELLYKTNEEARVIKRETYLRTRLMLERISRKLNAQIDDCCRAITSFGLDTNRELSDRLVRLKISIDDFTYDSEDTAKQIKQEFVIDSTK
jgi:hypothetical protein